MEDKSCCKKNWLLFIFSIVKLNGTRTINFLVELIVWRHPLVYVQVNKIETQLPRHFVRRDAQLFKFPKITKFFQVSFIFIVFS